MNLLFIPSTTLYPSTYSALTLLSDMPLNLYPNSLSVLNNLLCRGANGCLTSSVAVDKGHCSLGLRLMHTDEVWLSSVVEVKQGDLGVSVRRKP